MTIDAISTATNLRLYTDATAIAADLMALQQKCALYKERLYLIGIPDQSSKAVVGFEDAADLTKDDMATAASLVVEFVDFMSINRIQACAKLLRNVPAS